MFGDAKASNIDRPRSSLERLKMRYGFRSDGAADPLVVWVEGPKKERWERIAKGLYEMVSP